MPVAEVMHLPEFSVGLVDIAGDEDSENNNSSPARPLHGIEHKTTGLELGDSSPNFSPVIHWNHLTTTR